MSHPFQKKIVFKSLKGNLDRRSLMSLKVKKKRKVCVMCDLFKGNHSDLIMIQHQILSVFSQSGCFTDKQNIWEYQKNKSFSAYSFKSNMLKQSPRLYVNCRTKCPSSKQPLSAILLHWWHCFFWGKPQRFILIQLCPLRSSENILASLKSPETVYIP